MAKALGFVPIATRVGVAGGVVGAGWFFTEAGTELARKLDFVEKFYAGKANKMEGALVRGAVGALITVPAIMLVARKSKRAAANVGVLMGIGVLISAWGPQAAGYAREMYAKGLDMLDGKGGPAYLGQRKLADKMSALAGRQRRRGGTRSLPSANVGDHAPQRMNSGGTRSLPAMGGAASLSRQTSRGGNTLSMPYGSKGLVYNS